MADWRTPYDKSGRADVFAGEAVTLELDLQQPDGAGGWRSQDYTLRTFVQRVVNRAGIVLASVTASLITNEGPAPFLRFILSGDMTSALLVAGAWSTELRHEVAEVLGAGRDVILLNAFNVSLAANPLASLPGTSSGTGAGAARFTVQQGPRARIVVRYSGAPGASSAARVTFDDHTALLGATNVQAAIEALTRRLIALETGNPPSGQSLDFSDPANSGLLPIL